MSTTKMRGRGQVTIPAGLREELGLDEDRSLDIVKIGDALMLVPRALERERVAKAFEKEMQKQDVSLDDLLKDLKKIRKDYRPERHAR